MKLEFEYATDGSWIVAVFGANADIALLTEAAVKLRAYRETHPGAGSIADLRAIENFDVDARALRVGTATGVEWDAEHADRAGRFALVTDSDLTYALARQYQARRNSGVTLIEIFETREAAEAWLALPEHPASLDVG